MADGAIHLTLVQTTRPVRLEGQEEVPVDLLRREPFFAMHGTIEFGSGHSLEETARLAALAQVTLLYSMDLDVFEKREVRTEYGQLLEEYPATKIGTLYGGDRGRFVKVGEVPSEDSDAHPLPRHFTPGRRPSRGQRHVKRGRR